MAGIKVVTVVVDTTTSSTGSSTTIIEQAVPSLQDLHVE
jgi:hypothetical protein